MEEGALNGMAGLGAGLPTREQSGGRGGGGCSQTKRSETGLIGRRWSCGGEEGGGDYLQVAVHGGRGCQEGRGDGGGYRSPGPEAGCADPLSWTLRGTGLGDLGPGGQSKPQIQEGHNRGLGEE